MKRIFPLLWLGVFILAACSTSVETTPAVEPTAVEPTAAEAPPEEASDLALTNFRGELFSAHGNCAICHTDMSDSSGADVSTDRLWGSTMMANAARDPYWQAAVRNETLEFPEYQNQIEDKCSICHMPMARFTDLTKGELGKFLDDGDYLDPENELHPLAVDGVSCNLCHQVQADNLGDADSFSGGYQIDTQLAMGERQSFGPYDVGKQNALLMQNASGFIPMEGLHIEQAELCAVCHTLFTPYVDQNGELAGEFPEQTIYLEWSHSGKAEGVSCQGCHMPQAQGEVQLSTTGGPPRSPFYKHDFVGGNAFMGTIFQQFGGEMGAVASPQQFEDTAALAAQQIKDHTATLSLEDVRLEGSHLLGQIDILSQVGHKFPSGFPSRRVWLHLTVQDAAGKVVFESGAFGTDGVIQGNDNDQEAEKFEPHYNLITSPDQVQIYEDIIVDVEGNLTTTLLRGMGYIKDNRLLPSGFDKDSAPDDIAVQGAALEDEDFLEGGDRLAFDLDLSGAQGPFSIQVELLYQSIGYRWAENLRQSDSEESQRFLGYYAAIPNQPLLVAEAQMEIGE